MNLIHHCNFCEVLGPPIGSKNVAVRILYKIVFDVYLSVPYFIVQHNGVHNFKIEKLYIMRIIIYWNVRPFNLVCRNVHVFRRDLLPQFSEKVCNDRRWILEVTASNFSCVHMRIFFKQLFWSINCFLYVRPQILVPVTSYLFHRISRWLCVRLSFKVWNTTENTLGYLCIHSLAKLRYNYIP